MARHDTPYPTTSVGGGDVQVEQILRSAWSDRLTRWQPHVTRFLVATAVLWGGWLRLSWALRVPYNDAPDEFCHYAMVDFLRRENRLPTMADVPGRIPVSYPALSPLGYFPSVLSARIWPVDSPLYFRGMRIGNVVVGMLTILAGGLLAHYALPGRPLFVVATAWIMALHPQLVFLNAYINNDSSMVAVSTFLLAWLMRSLRVGPSLGNMTAAGVLAGIAWMAKSNALAIVAAAAPIFWLVMCRHGWRAAIGQAACYGTAFLSTCFPWFWWSWRHHRSVTGMDVHQRWWIDYCDQHGRAVEFLSRITWEDFLVATWQSYWGLFGYFCTPMSILDYALFAGLSTLAVVGWASGRFLLATADAWPDRSSVWAAMALLIVAAMAVFSGHVFHSFVFGLQSQGRYLMPATGALTILMILGWSNVRWRLPPSATVVLGLLVMAKLSDDAGRIENASSRVTQLDRRCKIIMLTKNATLPNAPRGEVEPSALVGPPLFSSYQDGFVRIATAIDAPRELRFAPCTANELGYLLLEFEASNPLEQEGFLTLILPDGSQTPPITFGLEYPGFARMTFDVRRLTETITGPVEPRLTLTGTGDWLFRHAAPLDAKRRPLARSPAQASRDQSIHR